MMMMRVILSLSFDIDVSFAPSPHVCMQILSDSDSLVHLEALLAQQQQTSREKKRLVVGGGFVVTLMVRVRADSTEQALVEIRMGVLRTIT